MDTAIYVIAHNHFTYIEEHSNERPLELMKIDYIELLTRKVYQHLRKTQRTVLVVCQMTFPELHSRIRLAHTHTSPSPHPHRMNAMRGRVTCWFLQENHFVLLLED